MACENAATCSSCDDHSSDMPTSESLPITMVHVLRNFDAGHSPLNWTQTATRGGFNPWSSYSNPAGESAATRTASSTLREPVQDPYEVCMCNPRRGSSKTNRQASHCTRHETPLISLEGMGLRQHLAASVSSGASMGMIRFYLVSTTEGAVTARIS